MEGISPLYTRFQRVEKSFDSDSPPFLSRSLQYLLCIPDVQASAGVYLTLSLFHSPRQAHPLCQPFGAGNSRFSSQKFPCIIHWIILSTWLSWHFQQLAFNLLVLSSCFIFSLLFSSFCLLFYLLEVSLNLFFILNFCFGSYIFNFTEVFFVFRIFKKAFWLSFHRYNVISTLFKEIVSLKLSQISPNYFSHLFVCFVFFQVGSCLLRLEGLDHQPSFMSLRSSLHISQTWALGASV